MLCDSIVPTLVCNETSSSLDLIWGRGGLPALASLDIRDMLH